MKQFKIINAYQFINTLSENDKLSYDTLWNLFQLKKLLQPHVDFFNEQLEKLKSKYLPKADENGTIEGETLVAYQNDISELSNMDKEIEIKKFTLKLKETPGLTLKAMDALEDFVEFEKE